jgi:replication-associated recombination protein RarA
MAALQACQVIGMPECRINLAHCVGYLSEAPKCTRAYEAYNRAEVAAKSDPTMSVPVGVRNAPTALMKELGYGEGYNYNPSFRCVNTFEVFTEASLNSLVPTGIPCTTITSQLRSAVINI